ncbi:hypothetical protein AgCh_031922 [Apium graveolens]
MDRCGPKMIFSDNKTKNSQHLGESVILQRLKEHNMLNKSMTFKITWMNCQRQFAEFVHTIQALQIELADLRQRNATSTDESRASELNIKDALQSGNNVGNQLNVSGDCQTHDSGTPPNGNFENDLSSKSQGNASGHVGRVKPLNYHMVKEDMRLQRKESRNRAVTILTLPIISFSQTPDN